MARASLLCLPCSTARCMKTAASIPFPRSGAWRRSRRTCQRPARAPPAMWSKATWCGWRMRLQLARALMCPSDLQLLDEPTNHLDLDALVWLEAWLKRYQGTMLVISHDREFLDAVTNVTIHLDDAKLIRYTGNYTAFEEMRAIRLTQATQSYEKQKERMAHLQKFIDRF